MDYLIDLTKEERLKLSRESTSFFLHHKMKKESKDLYDHLIYLFGDRYSTEIKTLITAYLSSKETNSISISLDKNNYILSNRITLQNINRDKIRYLLEDLDKRGYIDFYLGFYISKEENLKTFMRSIIKFKGPFLILLPKSSQKIIKEYQDSELVQIKDSKGKLISIKGKRGIRKELSLMSEFNYLIDNSEISIEGERVYPEYKTVFHNSSLQQGGRIYSGSFTNEKSILRKSIKINQEDTCEVDFKNIHFRILYQQKGIHFTKDCYSIKSYPGVSKGELRKIAKTAAVIMLNTKTQRSAKLALRRKLGISKGLTDHVINSLVEKHLGISDSLFKNKWAELQNIDSKIAKHIISVFIKKNIPILPYHDSFVVQTKYKDLLIKTMKEAWCTILGTYKSFNCEIEFDLSLPELEASIDKPKMALLLNIKVKDNPLEQILALGYKLQVPLVIRNDLL